MAETRLFKHWSCLNFVPNEKFFWKMILITVLLWKLVYCAIWSSSVSNSNEIIQMEDGFSGGGNTLIYRVVSGLVHNNLYYMYYLSTPIAGIIRKINSDGSFAWTYSIPYEPIMKSLSLDIHEDSLYFGTHTSTLNVIWLSASNGLLLSTNGL